MPTISAGQTASITLAAGSVLNIGDGASGEVVFMTGGMTGQSTKVNGASEVIGPFAEAVTLALTTQSGALVYSTTLPIAATGTAAAAGQLVPGNDPRLTRAPLAVSSSRALASTDVGRTLICTSSPTLTVAAGLGAWLDAKGTVTFAGASGVTVTDVRTTGATNPWCSLVQTDATGGAEAYDVVGGKA